ncbi:unnamed protein product [Spirodela intermedia]|uniref:Uncharacterized protein n=1 Tax=Spirodela intermedia TaxID=51605 RepID=A0A7I8IQ64_SPIIN|nr:unnamed protein product [Spirodela intermedia]CAA6659291.1 unnamed protein product [Spirodela intermedia]
MSSGPQTSPLGPGPTPAVPPPPGFTYTHAPLFFLNPPPTPSLSLSLALSIGYRELPSKGLLATGSSLADGQRQRRRGRPRQAQVHGEEVAPRSPSVGGKFPAVAVAVAAARSRSRASSTAVGDNGDKGMWRSDGGAAEEEVPLGLHPVYVGKSRRRYLISSHLVDHPLLRVLLQRSAGGAAEEAGGGRPTTVVGCEVVLFDHLLWMIENADPQPESLDELVEFYAV